MSDTEAISCLYEACGWQGGAVHQVIAEIKRLKTALATAGKERNEWADKWLAMRRQYAELRYPGMGNVIRALPSAVPAIDSEVAQIGETVPDRHCLSWAETVLPEVPQTTSGKVSAT